MLTTISGLRNHDGIGKSILIEAAECYPDGAGIRINGNRRALVKRERILAGTIPLVVIVIAILAGASFADVKRMSERLTAIARPRKHNPGSLHIGSVVEEDRVSHIDLPGSNGMHDSLTV